MRKSTRKPTKAQQARFEKLKALGCIACIKEHAGKFFCSGITEIHHLNLGGRAGQKRRGHDFTIPLGIWHHRGVVQSQHNWTEELMRLNFGPSLAKQSKLFRQTYGDDDQLLAEVNRLIGDVRT